MSWRGILLQVLGPFVPNWLWRWRQKTFRGREGDIAHYTAIAADCVKAFDLRRLATERGLDFSYRPRKNGFETRRWVIRRVDAGNYHLGALGGFGVETRDPTSDKRLVEYCLSVPMEEFLSGGVRRSLARRALADRLPEVVLRECRRGYQAADWHMGLASARAELAAEVERLTELALVQRILDMEKLKRLVANWPSSGWETPGATELYRFALLRGISAGYFLRRALGETSVGPHA